MNPNRGSRSVQLGSRRLGPGKGRVAGRCGNADLSPRGAGYPLGERSEAWYLIIHGATLLVTPHVCFAFRCLAPAISSLFYVRRTVPCESWLLSSNWLVKVLNYFFALIAWFNKYSLRNRLPGKSFCSGNRLFFLLQQKRAVTPFKILYLSSTRTALI